MKSSKTGTATNKFMLSRNQMLIATLVLMATIIGTSAVLAQSKKSSDLLEIELVVGYYMNSAIEGDVEMLAKAFHPSARLQSVREGEYQEMPIAAFIDGMTPGKKSDRKTRLLSVDCFGTAAVAKVELDYGRVKFIDMFSLLKIEGEWKIVNKIYFRDQ